MELINLPRIFHYPSAKEFLPINTKFDDPTAVYSLTDPINCKIFNFDRFIHDLAKIFDTVKKYSKIGQDFKNVVSNFAFFLTAIVNV